MFNMTLFSKGYPIGAHVLSRDNNKLIKSLPVEPWIWLTLPQIYSKLKKLLALM
jgi:hypothetical protein